MTAQRLSDDIKSAGIVLVADRAEGDILRWWKLDRQTGEAFGMNVHGGAEALLYGVITQESIDASVDAGFFIVGVTQCFGEAFKASGLKVKEIKGASSINSAANAFDFKVCMSINSIGYFAGGALSGKISALKGVQEQALGGFAVNIMMNYISSDVGGKVGNAISKAAK